MNNYNFIFPPSSFYNSVPQTSNMQNFIYNFPNQAFYNNYWTNNKLNSSNLNSASFPRYNILDSSGLQLLPVNSSYDSQALPAASKGKRRKYQVNSDLSQSTARKKSVNVTNFKEDELFRNRKNQLLHPNLSGPIEPFRYGSENAQEVKLRWEILKKASDVMTSIFKFPKFADFTSKLQKSIYERKLNERGYLLRNQNDKNPDDKVHVINYRCIKFHKPRIMYDIDSSINHNSIEKTYTILSNVQRRNIQKMTVASFDDVSLFTLAAQGETIRLDQKLAETNYRTIDDQDKNGYTVLIWACSWGHKHTVELLLYRGAKLNICSTDGKNPLMFAVQAGHRDIVEYLLRCGDDINHCDWTMTNSLMVAACKGHTDCFQLLLEWGIDLTTVTDEGKTVWDFSCTKACRKPIRVMLREYVEKLMQKNEDKYDDTEPTPTKLKR